MFGLFKFLFTKNPKKDPFDGRDYMPPDEDIVFSDLSDLNIETDRDQLGLGACIGCGIALASGFFFKKILSALFGYHECELRDDHPEQGTSLRVGMKVMRDVGICEEKYWEYDPQWPLKTPPPEAYENAKKYKITSYYRVTKLWEVIKAIASGYPVIMTCKIHWAWFDKSEFIDKVYGPSLGTHCVVIGGFHFSKLRLKIINSWGKKWKMKNKVWVSFAWFLKNSIDCWVPVIEEVK